MRTHQWKNGEELVVFRTGVSALEAGLIRGVLESNDIRYFVSEGDYYNISACIKVPASRLEDAERALEEAREMGERMAEDG
jgi:hypothetical protein